MMVGIHNIILVHAVSHQLDTCTPWPLGGGMADSNTLVPDHVVETMVRQGKQSGPLALAIVSS